MCVIMYNKILLATDGSENAGRAAENAGRLSRELSSHLIVVYIFGNPPSQSEMAKANFDIHSILEKEARAEIKYTLEYFEELELEYTLKVAIGDPATEIIETTDKEKADLVVIGSRGLGALKGAVIGSVSQKVTQHVNCPVMIVK